MPRFRKKPVEVEAVQFTDENYLPKGVTHELIDLGAAAFCVTTIHGQLTPVQYGDWIITEPDGIHHYPCKPDIFEATYEPC